jgi:hypothetical protein
MKRALLEKKPNIDLSKLVGISEAFKSNTDVKKHSLFSRLFARVAQASLIVAFIFLAMFVQVNLPLLLTSGK